MGLDPGVIAQKMGPLTYLIDVSGGRLWKRHVDHIKDHRRPITVSDDTEIDVDLPEVPETLEPGGGNETVSTPETETTAESADPTPTVETNAPGPSTESRRYPDRF